MSDNPRRINWDRLTFTSINAQFVTELDVALLLGDTATVTALLEWREAYVVVSEFWQHCDRHMRAYYDGDDCDLCKSEQGGDQ
jgi:hypothetical protein